MNRFSFLDIFLLEYIFLDVITWIGKEKDASGEEKAGNDWNN